MYNVLMKWNRLTWNLTFPYSLWLSVFSSWIKTDRSYFEFHTKETCVLSKSSWVLLKLCRRTVNMTPTKSAATEKGITLTSVWPHTKYCLCSKRMDLNYLFQNWVDRCIPDHLHLAVLPVSVSLPSPPPLPVGKPRSRFYWLWTPHILDCGSNSLPLSN